MIDEKLIIHISAPIHRSEQLAIENLIKYWTHARFDQANEAAGGTLNIDEWSTQTEGTTYDGIMTITASFIERKTVIE